MPFASARIRQIACLSWALLLVLFLIRPQVLSIPYRLAIYPWSLYIILLASYYDVLLTAGLSAWFMGMSYALRRHPGVQPWLLGAFTGCALLSVWAGLAHVTTNKLLDGPLTYAWLYYADFLQNSDAKAALGASLSWGWLAEVLGWSATLLGAGCLLNYTFRRLDPTGRWVRRALLATAAGLLVFFVVAPRRAARQQLTYKLMANPVLAFTQSVYRALLEVPALFTMQVPAGFEAFPRPLPTAPGASQAPFDRRIRNVVLFVLESVPAEYVPGYQTRFHVMPELERHLPESLLITDMYAQMPSTNNAVVALLTSLYPQISYQSISKEHPAIPVPSLSSELKKQGFRTSFFFAADTRFQGMNEFLSHRNFDFVADCQTIACPKPKLEVDKTEQFLASVDEACLLSAATQQLPPDAGQKPFLMTIWTAQTHYPYFPPTPEINYHVSELYLNRYLNALHYSDIQLGRLLDELQRRGLAESTLVVVVGDHGEAFGRHMQYGHASNIYEENVHIPLLLLNPLLFHGEKRDQIGGQIDIAPSILDLLHLPAPPQWQGTSLFNPAHLNRAYFFDPYSGYYFGYRTPQYKVILDADASKTLVFDLQKDPHETTSLSGRLPEFVRQSHQRLARFVQYQNAYIKHLIGPASATSPPAK